MALDIMYAHSKAMKLMEVPQRAGFPVSRPASERSRSFRGLGQQFRSVGSRDSVMRVLEPVALLKPLVVVKTRKFEVFVSFDSPVLPLPKNGLPLSSRRKVGHWYKEERRISELII
jgi:hypothetical protein